MKNGFDAVETFDTLVGRLLKKVDDNGLASNTIVIFTSDNGGLSAREFENKPAPRTRHCGKAKDICMRAAFACPSLCDGRESRKPAASQSTPSVSVDWVATLTGASGTDGQNILPVLRGGSLPKPRPLFWHYPHYSNQGGDPGAAVRLGDLKLIRFYGGNHEELYDLGKDVGEKNDLAAKMPEKRKELAGTLDVWLKEIDAAMPTPNAKYDAAREQQGLRWVPKSE